MQIVQGIILAIATLLSCMVIIAGHNHKDPE
jgi:hypothetical protein